MSEELKPCPFCGGEACEWEDEGVFAIYCTTCGVEVTHNISIDMVIKRWNTRKTGDITN